MADLSKPEERAASFGKVGAAFGFGFIMGPAIGGFLAEWGTRLPFFVAGGMAVANCLYGLVSFPETMDMSTRRPISLKRANPMGALISLGTHKSVLPIASIYFLWIVATNIYPACWSFFAQAQYGWNSIMVGVSLTITGVSMAICQAIIIGKAVKRFGERRTAQLGLTIGGLIFAIYASFPFGWLALTIGFFSGIQGMAIPALNAMMSRRVPASQQGELQGLNTSMSALSFLIAQIVYNNALAYFTSPEAPFRFAGAPFAIAACITAVALVALLRLAPAQDGQP